VSYGGVGVLARPDPRHGPQTLGGGVARTDGHLDVDKDSTRVGEIDLPAPWALRPGSNFPPSHAGRHRGLPHLVGQPTATCSRPGGRSDNTIDLSFGGEFLSDIRRPSRRPIRFGGTTRPAVPAGGRQQPTESGSPREPG
jgi:hypothetical protein